MSERKPGVQPSAPPADPSAEERDKAREWLREYMADTADGPILTEVGRLAAYAASRTAPSSCHICGKPARFRCVDCHNNLKVIVHLCESDECMKKHELVCSETAIESQDLQEELERAERQLAEARQALQVIRVSTEMRHVRKIAERVLGEKP